MTEETNMSSEEEQESEKTSTEEKTSASEPVVPLHEHTALRGRAQAAELKAANLEGQLTAMQQTTSQAVKSPMDIEIARQVEEGIAEEDMTITPALYRQQQAFEKQQTEQATVASAKQVRSEAQLASRELSMVTHPDWQDTVNAAIKHMTKGEMLDLESERENFGEAIYAKAQEVLERVKPVKTTAPETSESEAEKLAAEKLAAEKAADATNLETPTQEEILADLSVDPVTAAALKL